MISNATSFAEKLELPCLVIDTSNTYCQFGLITRHALAKNEVGRSTCVKIRNDEFVISIPNPRESYPALQGMAEVIDCDLLDFLNSLAISIKDVRSIVCSVGPGSFTGLRTGLAFSKGLQFSLEVPLVLCSNLLAAGLVVSAKTINSRTKISLKANKDENFVSTLEVINDLPVELSDIEVESIGNVEKHLDVETCDISELQDFEIMEGYLRAFLFIEDRKKEFSSVRSVITRQVNIYENDLNVVEPYYVKGVSALTLVERGIKSPLDQIKRFE